MRTIRPAVIATLGPALLATALLLASCSRGAAPTSAPPPAAGPAPAAAPPQAAPPATADRAVATAAATFFLEIAAPKDQSVVAESSVLVEGRTVPDAVVSVNGQPVEVDASGKFSTRVTLESGPNAIEVIASDFRGNYQPKVITVVYLG